MKSCCFAELCAVKIRGRNSFPFARKKNRPIATRQFLSMLTVLHTCMYKRYQQLLSVPIRSFTSKHTNKQSVPLRVSCHHDFETCKGLIRQALSHSEATAPPHLLRTRSTVPVVSHEAMHARPPAKPSQSQSQGQRSDCPRREPKSAASSRVVSTISACWSEAVVFGAACAVGG